SFKGRSNKQRATKTRGTPRCTKKESVASLTLLFVPNSGIVGFSDSYQATNGDWVSDNKERGGARHPVFSSSSCIRAICSSTSAGAGQSSEVHDLPHTEAPSHEVEDGALYLVACVSIVTYSNCGQSAAFST